MAAEHGFSRAPRADSPDEGMCGDGRQTRIERRSATARTPKKASVALHYRRVAGVDRPAIQPIVDRVLAEHPGELKVTPDNIVYEIQPKLEWDEGKAALYLLKALGLDGDDVAPLYLGDDVTDEDAFRVLSGKGIGIFVGQADDPEIGGRGTSAAFVLGSIEEVERFLDTLAR